MESALASGFATADLHHPWGRHPAPGTRPYQSVVNRNKANLEVAKAQLEKDRATLTYAQQIYDCDARVAASINSIKDSDTNDAPPSPHVEEGGIARHHTPGNIRRNTPSWRMKW